MMSNEMSDAEIFHLLYNLKELGVLPRDKVFCNQYLQWLPTFVGDLAPTNVAKGHGNLVMYRLTH